tara:strand:- start:1822 stop:3201 length:1380 start_codon:yes stop_codon:yes gene_type:complete
MPYVHDLGGNALMCVANNDHQTYQAKDTGTKMLRHPEGHLVEVDVLTQRETTELAPITDQATALATVKRASALGLFPDKATPEQAALLAEVALAYRLDPLMGEIMPYQGAPYITIKGRRRLDNAAGHAVSVSFRPPMADEEAYFRKVGAIDDYDLIQICVGVDTKTGARVEGFGRVLAKERETAGRSAAAVANLPTLNRAIEMAQKRAERRMREEMFGPVAKPEGLGIQVLHEGDESMIVEGEARVVDNGPDETDARILGQGDLGSCAAHDAAWIVEENNYGHIHAYHIVPGEKACRFGHGEGTRFQAAYKGRFGEYKKAEADAWLKDNFHGKTWSKMEPVEMLDARTLMESLAAAHQEAADPSPVAEPIQPPSDDDTGLETAQDATAAISEEQLQQLMNLAKEVNYFDLISRINEVTGNANPVEIPADAFDGIMAWVNNQIDQKIAEKEAGSGDRITT